MLLYFFDPLFDLFYGDWAALGLIVHAVDDEVDVRPPGTDVHHLTEVFIFIPPLRMISAAA
jgi:hypothetical protein